MDVEGVADAMGWLVVEVLGSMIVEWERMQFAIMFRGDNKIFKIGFLLMMRVLCENVFFGVREEYVLLRFNKMGDFSVVFFLFIALLQPIENYNHLIIILPDISVFKS